MKNYLPVAPFMRLFSRNGFSAGMSWRRGCVSVMVVFLTIIAHPGSMVAQLIGTLNIPGSYASLEQAINDLNTQGVGIGGVTINLLAGNPQTAPAGGYVIGGAGSLVLTTSSNTNPITIMGNGNTITAFSPQVSGNLNDALIKLIGADWVTIDGFTLTENSFNATTTAGSNDMTEWGIALLYVTTTDGAQNNTIQNCTIDLDRSYQNTFGIYSNSTHTATAVSVSATATTVDGGNSGLRIYSNMITDVNNGVVVVGPTGAADYNEIVEIGGTVSTGNTITNYGTTGTFSSYANVSGTVNGILVRNSRNFTISNNTISSSVGGVTSGTLNGIQLPAFSTAPTGTFTNTISHNTISVRSGVASGATNGINSLGTSASATSTINITHNDFNTCGHTVTASGTIIFINQAGIHLNQNISNNTFTNMSVNTTGSVTFIANTNSNPNASGIKNVNNNAIVTGFSKTGAGGTVTFITDNGIDANGVTSNCNNNSMSNITITGATSVVGIGHTNGSSTAPNKNIGNNTIQMISGGTTGSVTGISVNFDVATTNVFENSINSITNGGLITGINFGTSGAGAVTAQQNVIHTLTGTGTGAVTGILMGGATSSTKNSMRNKIYNLENNNSGGSVSGITAASGTSLNIVNNLIGDLRGPSLNAVNSLRGINITSSTTNSNLYISYNTIYLNATSSGTNFGSSGIFHTTNATATTAALHLINNIVVNLSTPNGTGLTTAYQRSSTALNNYASASNNNLFYAGLSGPANLIFHDGTNSDQNIGDYVARVTPRDIASITENPVFLSTAGGSANFLHMDASVATFIEGGGIPIVGITDDYDGDVRDGTAPDIGADEFAGMVPTCSGAPAPSNAVVSPGPWCNGNIVTLTLDETYFAVDYQWQSSPDDAIWTNIDGATFSNLNIAVTMTTYFRAVITCPASSMSTNSASVLVTIPGALSGAYTIDNTMPTAGTNYNSFTEAIDDLNCRGIGSSVTFNVTAGQVFPSSAGLNITATGTSTETVSFVRTGLGANPIIQRLGTSATTDYILRIGGGDYFTFDGIDFEQTGVDATDIVEFGIYLQNVSATNGAQHNMFKNGMTTMTKSSVNSKGVYVHSPIAPTSADGTNSHNRFINWVVFNSWEGYRITGASTTFLDDGNEINTEMGGLSKVESLGDGTAATAVYGVFSTHQTNFVVNNTEIRDLSPGGTALAYGITLQTAALNTATFSNNHIHSISGGGTISGYHITSAESVTLFNNQIHALSTSGNASSLRGINAGGTGAEIHMYANRIYNLSSTGTTSTTVAGIEVGTGDLFTIENNMVSGLTAPSSTSTTGGTRGIMTSGSTAGQVVRVYNNTVLLTDVGAVAGYTSAGFHNSSNTPSIDFRNNLIVNLSDVTTGTRAVAYWKSAAAINQHFETNNNLYYAGAPGAKNLLYYDGTNSAQTLGDILGIAGMLPREQFSRTENVAFDPVMNGIVRPDPTTPTLVESNAIAITGVSEDFENDPRGPYPLGGQVNGGGSAPDIGADEGDFTFIPPPIPDCPTLNAPIDLETDVCHYQDVVLSWTAALSGGAPTGGYDVYFGPSMTPLFLTNTNSTTYIPGGIVGNETYYWKIVPKNATGEAVGCATYSFTTVDIGITSTTPGSRCGDGSVMLGAAGTGILNWYDTPIGGAVLGTGTVFNTPVITGTTDFYVSASDGGTMENVASPTIGTSTFFSAATGWGLRFTVNSACEINSVTIRASNSSAGAASMQIKITDLTDMVLYTGTLHNFNITTSLADYIIPVDILVAPGDYKMVMTSTGINNLVRESGGVTFPYNAPSGAVSITAGANGTGTAQTTSAYYWFYNWVISTGCQSPRTMVTATITPADPILVDPAAVTRCLMDPPTSITASSTASYTYSWDPAPGLNMTSGATVEANPSVTTTYSVTGDDGTCINTSTVVVTVNLPPDNPMAFASADPVCPGEEFDLTSSYTPLPATLLSLDFESGLGTWNVANMSTGGTDPSLVIWTTRPNGYGYSTDIFSGNQATQFLMANSDAAGNGVVAKTTLTSPSFSTVGYTSLTLTYIHYYRHITAAGAFTEISTNGGSSWTSIQSYAVTTGTAAAFANESLDLGAYLGLQDVIIRFRYEGGWFWYWALDDIELSGTSTDPTFEWTSSPAGFISSMQNPTGVSQTVATEYFVDVIASNGCASQASTGIIGITPSPTITLGADPVECVGALTTNLMYSGTTESPDEYSIDFDGDAELEGFVDVVNAALPANPIMITIPGAAPEGVYNAVLTVRNSGSGCNSSSTPFTITMMGQADPGIVSGAASLCINRTDTYMTSGNLGGMWSSTNPSVATVHPVTGLVTALTAGMTDITYEVDNGCGGPASSFQTLTVDPAVVLNNNASGPGSLAEVIACVGEGTDVTFDASLMGATILLTSTITIDKNLTLDGLGMMNLTISGGGLVNIFHVQSGTTFNIDDIALKNGYSATPGQGGAIFNEGTVRLNQVCFQTNFEDLIPQAWSGTGFYDLIGNVDVKN